MKSNYIILTSLLLIFTLFSCERDRVNDEIVEITLMPAGCWTEIEHESTLQFAGTNHTFCFLSDTEFKLELESWSDIVTDINTPNTWSEYIKGTYVWTNESLEITGLYMDSDYTNFVTSRSGETEYSKTYEVKVVSETEFILDNNDIMPYRGIRLLN